MPSERSPSDDLTTDQIFDVLGNEHRRHAITALRERDSELELDELTTEVHRRCAGDPGRQRVETALYHAHLPRLDCAGIVRYEADGEVVELTETAAQLDSFLDLVDE